MSLLMAPSLLARSGLWRVTRHEYVREFYHKLDEAGVFLAQLDRFERPTGSGGNTETTPEAIAFEVVPVTERYPEDLDATPIAPSDRVVLARRAGETVGWCCLSDRPVYVPELHRRLRLPGSYLWRLYVTPEERGRGIGSAIIEQAVDHSRTALGVRTITALVAPDNLPSRRAFQRLGFTPTERFTSCGCLGREWHRRRAME